MGNFLRVFEIATKSFGLIQKGITSVVKFFKKKKENQKKEIPYSSSSITINNYGTIDKVVNIYVLNTEEANKVMDKLIDEEEQSGSAHDNSKR